jgi:hypothetical protein
MTSKKIITIVFVGLIFGFNAQAARTVPVNEPLQPMPENTYPNVSNNINSADSEVNQSLEADLPIEQTPDGSEPTVEPGATDNQPIVADAAEPATTTYWILLFVGIVGLVGIAFWVYTRFFRKP